MRARPLMLFPLAGLALTAAALPTLALHTGERAIIAGRQAPSWKKTQRRLNELWRGHSRLNRSRRWDYAETYADARSMSPFPYRPVR